MWWDYPLFAALTIVGFVAIAYFLVYWLSSDDWHAHPIIFTLLTAILGFNLLMHQMRWFTLPLVRRPCPILPPPGYKVAVVTTFVAGAESLAMLEDTLSALVAMRYPHDTWVLDEADADSVKDLCRRLGAHHFSRRGLARYQAASGPFASETKYGNYNTWLTELGYERYDIVSAFDPDHVPRRNFLTAILGYFTDPHVGYVQAPQAYYNQRASFIARGAAEQTYSYSSSMQMADFAVGYTILMGCHTTHRSSALRQVGGFAQHHADDLLLTIYYRMAGWRGVYLPEILARGLTPVDWHGYLRQQRRWAGAVLDVKFRSYPRIAGKLPLRERLIGYVHGLYSVQGLTPPLGMLLLMCMLLTGSVPAGLDVSILPRLGALGAALALAGAYRQRFFLDRRREWGFHWRAMVLEWARWPAMLAAFLDVVSGGRAGFTITRKVRADPEGFILLAPHGLAAVLLSLTWVVGMMRGLVTSPMLHVATAAVVIASLGLIATEHLPFPEPYDRCLLKDEPEASLDARTRQRG